MAAPSTTFSRAKSARSRSATDADLIEALWEKIWWGLHYGGRGGPATLAQSAFDIALWDLKAKRAGLPLFRLLGGYDPLVPCYAGGIDLELTTDGLLSQTEGKSRRADFARSR